MLACSEGRLTGGMLIEELGRFSAGTGTGTGTAGDGAKGRLTGGRCIVGSGKDSAGTDGTAIGGTTTYSNHSNGLQCSISGTLEIKRRAKVCHAGCGSF